MCKKQTYLWQTSLEFKFTTVTHVLTTQLFLRTDSPIIQYFGAMTIINKLILKAKRSPSESQVLLQCYSFCMGCHPSAPSISYWVGAKQNSLMLLLLHQKNFISVQLDSFHTYPLDILFRIRSLWPRSV